MSQRMTAVDREILAVLSLECARSQGYIKSRTGRSRQQIHTRLQILAGRGWIRAIHRPTAVYEIRDDPRPADDEAGFDPVHLILIDSDGERIGEEWIAVDSSGTAISHRYQIGKADEGEDENGDEGNEEDEEGEEDEGNEEDDSE